MRIKLKHFTILMSIWCMTHIATYGMTLTYDGASHTYDKASIALYVNSQMVEPSIMPPVQIEGYVLVPTREVFNAMGATVHWKSQEKKVYIEEKDSLIVLELNNNEAWVNGEVKSMDMVPKVINDKIMVPIRFISETLGFKVDWLGVERCVYITKEENNNMSDNNIVSSEDQMTDNGSDYINELPQDNNQQAEDNNSENILLEENELNRILPMLKYDPITQTMLIEGNIQTTDIMTEDLYTKRKIVFNISNLSDMTEGSWQGDLGYLKGITVTKLGDMTQIVVETNTICATTVGEQEGSVAIKFMKPGEKYEKIIVVDAGHGGSDNGTSANGVNEKDLTLSYGKALCALLEVDDRIKVYATRPEDEYATVGDGVVGKQYPTLDMRVNLANEIAPDLCISIHINSYTNSTPNGIETYYYADSDSRGQVFANMVQMALIDEFMMTDRKAKHGDLKMVRETNKPAVLIEAGFISNAVDYAVLTSYDYPNRFAQVVYECILNYYAQGLNG